ncbi:hypothetical protein BH09ACT12_BH09ACT12_04020 [soil metagenome]
MSQIGFCLAVPAFRGIDEFDHAFRASSVGHGHWWAGTRESVRGRGFLLAVDASIAAAAFTACDDLEYTGPDNCTPLTEPNAAGEVIIASAAATYNPAWYAVTGLAARPFSGDRALLAMRITGMLMVDALIFGAILIAGKSRSPLWMLGGIAIACTPVLTYSSTVAAPNGTTYAAGVLLWVSLLRLSEDSEPGRGTWLGAGVGACALMVTHSTGVMFLLVTLLCVAPIFRGRLRELWKNDRRNMTIVATCVAVIGLVCVAWILAAGTNDPRDTERTFGSMPLQNALIGPALWFLQSIATLVFRDEPAPAVVYVLGATSIIALIAPGFLRARRNQRVSMVMIMAFSLAIPIILTWLAYSTQGFGWQGRYGLPLSVGLMLLAAQALGNTVDANRLAPALAALLTAMVASHAVTIGALAESRNGALSGFQLVALVTMSLLATAFLVGATLQLGRESTSNA